METELLQTHFAAPERASDAEIARQVATLRASALIRTLFDSVPDPVVVLNAHRQIVHANNKLTAMLNRTADQLIGLRLGEAVNCEHAFAAPAGCGTTEFCKVCGAAKAIQQTASQGLDSVEECHILRSLDGGPPALDLRVWTKPLPIGEESFTILAIRDITDEKRRRMLERMFFHDVLNSAWGLQGLLEIHHDMEGQEAREVEALAQKLAAELLEEIENQRDLNAAERGELAIDFKPVDMGTLLTELCSIYRYRAAERGKLLVLKPPVGRPALNSSDILLRRVAGNLIKNALEASTRGQTVTVGFSNPGVPPGQTEPAGAVLTVHNEMVMPRQVQLQIFQRSFSTKPEPGHGVGSYSVKLLTERYLQGKVGFVSTAGAGTTFWISLPGD